MKTLLFASLLLAFACDAPKQTRYPTTPTYNGGVGAVDGVFTGGGTSQDESSDDPYQDPSDPATPSRPGFENCNLGHRYDGGSIGSFGVCQSTQDERVFATSFAQADASVGTCFVPMHLYYDQYQRAVSYNVGRAECVHNQANTTYYPVLYKNQNKPINAVMVIKYSSLNPFMQCLNAKSNYINGHPGCMYDQNCINAAQQYASMVCTSFTDNHSNHYKQVSF